MTRDVMIIGAGGFGRELLQYSLDAEADGWPHRVVGFLDDNPRALDDFGLSVGIEGSTRDHLDGSGISYMVALGDPEMRSRQALRILKSGGRLEGLVHPTAYVSQTATLGDGVLLCPFALIAAHAVVESNVALNVYASVGHDATVGANTVVSPYVAITGSVKIGDDCFLGAHSTIVPGVGVGRCCKVAAGAVVTRDAPDGSLLHGNPAKGRVMFRVTGVEPI